MGHSKNKTNTKMIADSIILAGKLFGLPKSWLVLTWKTSILTKFDLETEKMLTWKSQHQNFDVKTDYFDSKTKMLTNFLT